MKNPLSLQRVILPVSIALITLAACNKEETVTVTNSRGNSNYNTQVNALPKEALSSFESGSLSFMREEEKLAMDVYQYLYGKLGVNIFTNIASSEQTHMDAVLLLLDKYNLADPAKGLAAGIFKNAALQDLYWQLTAQGEKSLLDGYIVGATIEDLDLKDLYDALERADNQDITYVYENLAKGSRNHLRSFYKNIQNAGGSYSPQYISQAEFDSIISSPMESGY